MSQDGEKTSRRLVITQLGAMVLVVPTAGCGYMLYPERRGNTLRTQLDASVVIMDALLILFFVIPGLIAFAIDINSGCIYMLGDMTDATPRLHRRLLKRRRLTDIEEAIAEACGDHRADLCVLDPAVAPASIDTEVLEVLTALSADAVSLHPASVVVVDVDNSGTVTGFHLRAG